MWRRSSLGWFPVATHILDIVAFSVFQYLTTGPSSPLFVYFVFSLFCGAIRWGWRGTVWTAPAAVAAAFIAMGMPVSHTIGSTEFELNRFVVRMGHLLMVTGLLVYLGRHEARQRNEIERLARWPPVVDGDSSLTVRRLLEHAASILDARRAVAVWKRQSERRLHRGIWTPERFEVATHDPAAFEPLLPDALDDSTLRPASPWTPGSDTPPSRIVRPAR